MHADALPAAYMHSHTWPCHTAVCSSTVQVLQLCCLLLILRWLSTTVPDIHSAHDFEHALCMPFDRVSSAAISYSAPPPSGPPCCPKQGQDLQNPAFQLMATHPTCLAKLPIASCRTRASL